MIEKLLGWDALDSQEVKHYLAFRDYLEHIGDSVTFTEEFEKLRSVAREAVEGKFKLFNRFLIIP